MHQAIPVQVLHNPYAGMTRAQLLEILLWARELHQDPLYPELFRMAWSAGRPC